MERTDSSTFLDSCQHFNYFDNFTVAALSDCQSSGTVISGFVSTKALAFDISSRGFNSGVGAVAGNNGGEKESLKEDFEVVNLVAFRRRRPLTSASDEASGLIDWEGIKIAPQDFPAKDHTTSSDHETTNASITGSVQKSWKF